MSNSKPHRTDSRTLAARKASIAIRIAELRYDLRAAEQAAAEIDAEIEESERKRELRSGCNELA